MSLNHILTSSGLSTLDMKAVTMRAGTGIFQNLIAPNITTGTGIFTTVIAGTGIFNNAFVNGPLVGGTGTFNTIIGNTGIFKNEIVNGPLIAGTGTFNTVISGTGIFNNGFVNGPLTAGTGIFTNGITLPTTGGTPGLLNYYENSASFNLAFTGPASVSVACNITMVGTSVCLTFGGIPSTGTSANTFFDSGVSLIPGRFLPGRNLYFPIINTDSILAATGQVGILVIQLTGEVKIYATAAFGNFSNAANIVVEAIGASWVLSA
jgi:hypothetical protein